MKSFLYMISPMLSWRRLLRLAVEAPADRAAARAGRRMLMSRAMMPMTTRSSTNVNPRRELRTQRGV